MIWKYEWYIKIIKSLEESGLSIIGVSQINKNEVK